MTITTHDALGRLLAALVETGPATAAPARLVPADGEPVSEWHSALVAAREAADNAAVRHRVRIDAVSRRLFGHDLSGLLPTPTSTLRRSELTVAIPPRAQLGDLVPELADVAPHGPESPVAEPGDGRIRVRVTAPPAPTAAVVRLHGGAFWMGGGDVSALIDGAFIDHIAQRANAAVLDVDYRLAPEHPYPAAIIDTLCVLDAVRSGALWFTPAAIALLGTSSGANTAAIAARADALRAPSTPIAALALTAPSMLLSDAPPVLRRDPAAWRTRLAQLRGYIGDSLDAADPWISPGVESVIEGMPPTFMAIAEHDEVAIGGEELRDAILAGRGVVEVRRYPMTHTVAPPDVEAAVITDTARFVRERLAAAR